MLSIPGEILPKFCADPLCASRLAQTCRELNERLPRRIFKYIPPSHGSYVMGFCGIYTTLVYLGGDELSDVRRTTSTFGSYCRGVMPRYFLKFDEDGRGWLVLVTARDGYLLELAKMVPRRHRRIYELYSVPEIFGDFAENKVVNNELPRLIDVECLPYPVTGYWSGHAFVIKYRNTLQ